MYIGTKNIIRTDLSKVDGAFERDYLYIELNFNVISKEQLGRIISKYDLIDGDVLLSMYDDFDKVWISLVRDIRRGDDRFYYSNRTPYRLIATMINKRIKLFVNDVYVYQLDSFIEIGDTLDEIYNLHNEDGDFHIEESVEEILSDIRNNIISIKDLSTKDIERIKSFNPENKKLNKEDIIIKIEALGIDSLTDEELQFMINN